MDEKKDDSRQKLDSPLLARSQPARSEGSQCSSVNSDVRIIAGEHRESSHTQNGHTSTHNGHLASATNYTDIAGTIVHGLPVFRPCPVDQSSTLNDNLTLDPLDDGYKKKDSVRPITSKAGVETSSQFNTSKELSENVESEYSSKFLIAKSRKSALDSFENNNERHVSTPPKRVPRDWPYGLKRRELDTRLYSVGTNGAFVSETDSTKNQEAVSGFTPRDTDNNERNCQEINQTTPIDNHCPAPLELYQSSRFHPLPLLPASHSMGANIMAQEDQDLSKPNQSDLPSGFVDSDQRINSLRYKYKVRFLPLQPLDHAERAAVYSFPRGSSVPPSSGSPGTSASCQNTTNPHPKLELSPVHGYNRWRSRRNAITSDIPMPGASQNYYQSTLALHEVSTSSNRYPQVQGSHFIDQIDRRIVDTEPIQRRPDVAPPSYEECVRTSQHQASLACKIVGGGLKSCKPPRYTPITHVMPETYNVEDYTQFMDVGPQVTPLAIGPQPTPARRRLERPDGGSWCHIDESDHQLMAVLGCLVCWPLGLVAVYYSNMCRILRSHGNDRQAKFYGRTAFVFSLAAITFGVVAYMGMYVYQRYWW